MVKVFVVYDTKHDVEDTDPEEVAAFDAILVGSPNHFGGPVRGINRFIDKLGKLDLKAKWAAVFDTYLGEDFEKAVKKMEKRISEKVPGLKLIASGLSIRVDDMKGPVTDGELPKCREFGKKIANLLET